jgi:hypothetical protein
MSDVWHSFSPRTRYSVILIASLILALYTGNKLYTMAQVRGFVPGARVTQQTVTQKYIGFGKRGDVYWISWTKEDIRKVGDHRTNLEYDEWVKYEEGDPIEVIYANNSSTPFLRNDIFTTNGNFVFDGLLLTAELGTACFMIFLLFKTTRRTER